MSIETTRRFEGPPPGISAGYKQQRARIRVCRQKLIDVVEKICSSKNNAQSNDFEPQHFRLGFFPYELESVMICLKKPASK